MGLKILILKYPTFAQLKFYLDQQYQNYVYIIDPCSQSYKWSTS